MGWYCDWNICWWGCEAIAEVGQRGTTIWIPLNLQPDCEISRKILIVRGFISSKEGKYYCISLLSSSQTSRKIERSLFTHYSLLKVLLYYDRPRRRHSRAIHAPRRRSLDPSTLSLPLHEAEQSRIHQQTHPSLLLSASPLLSHLPNHISRSYLSIQNPAPLLVYIYHTRLSQCSRHICPSPKAGRMAGGRDVYFDDG
ncbi:hypothetical protein M430DRAFT_163464 [Amorphotheca resinae ATCC 22711]|uniref:Uncharacterized protein n=1 Tax=Amorphotheca resinae ATCC 22711 TaxID=857342 RepID=A0A2T3BFD6_AMORE|nr:hypothetical protein M430DRAFT_163464 [Amorphotheca resinae ATCC 22711]PSS28137.1 hypothetical protein M430DRAFT_163464 [Amorphotheca resinae ATCC 22711]